jgi:hypothetical protein
MIIFLFIFFHNKEKDTLTPRQPIIYMLFECPSLSLIVEHLTSCLIYTQQ